MPPAVRDYRREAREYDDRRYIGRADSLKEGFRRRALKELLPLHAKKALDVACGTGRGLMILRDIASVVYGVDGTREMLQVVQKKVAPAYIGVFQANAASMPFASGTFDVVTCLNFLHLFNRVEDKTVFVREMGRVMKPGAVAVVEFDNALQGLVLGPLRKYLGRDIGYDWPWVMRSCFPPDLFVITCIRGVNLPGVWRIPLLRLIERLAGRFPLNYLGTRMLIKAVRT